MDIAIMIEGQNGLNWPRWQAIVRAVEDLGFAGLYRSDHFTNAGAPDLDSLELWTALTWLAANTSRIDFGPLVSPVSFRHPALTARMAAAVDDLSGGRLWLGLGAGWQEREHALFGFDLLPLRQRFDRFEEGLQVISRLLNSDEPVSYDGQYYQLREAILLPRPARPGGPPLLIGGNGQGRTLDLAARFAQEWNAFYLTPADFAERSRRLDERLSVDGRGAGELRRSMMTGLRFARTQRKLDEQLQARNVSAEHLRSRGVIVGVGQAILGQLHALQEAGVQRVMLQWLDLDDLDGLQALGEAVLPHFPGG